MLALTDNIASWDEDYLPSEQQFAGQDGIATEAQQPVSPAWQECIDALLKTWTEASSHDDGCDPRPNRVAIKAAIAWVIFLRKHYPNFPPTCITREPDGGLIVERRSQSPNGDDRLCELTFYNDGRAEETDFFNGRVLQMNSIPQGPQGQGA